MIRRAKMDQKRAQLDGEALSCSVCLDLLKDPTTLPCGHSYCMSCIQNYWREGSQRRTHSCPQCRRTFNPRPVLEKNIMLAELVEELKKTSDCKEHLLHQFMAPASQKHNQEDICPSHDEEMKIFCRTDQQCICYICLMNEHQGHETAQIAEERFEKQEKLQVTRQQAQQKTQDCAEAVKELQQKVKIINTYADKAVEDSEKVFAEMIRLIHKRSSEVKEKIRSHQEAEVSRVLSLQEELEQEIRDLKSKEEEIEMLSHTDDHCQFLHRYSSLSALSQSTHSSGLPVCPLRFFEEVTKAASDTRDKLQELLRDKQANLSPKSFIFICVLLIIYLSLVGSFMLKKDVSLPEPEPKSREDFLKYSGELTLDPNTANPHLVLSEANRKAAFTHIRSHYHNHPDRFIYWTQVLSKEKLWGRRYWEVEWTGGAVYVAVAYKNVQTSRFGHDHQSWALYCDKNSYVFYHKGLQTPLLGPVSSRVGVYLDHGAGVLSFYRVSETMTLLYTVQTTFTQPLHAGLGLYDYFLYTGGDSAEFIKLK
ncbi:tripartite motif-containing protein 16-like protein [Oryzias melastigma]|uniref:Tripartite motif-containing protein 16-like protein n=1 Tax=Oryzias melastigma TaxID=30732 RepID=A0A3B3CUR2_ORYME|nr:tripartite motif-containing protein 16-like protein [Oryzias melastigma]